VFLLKRSIQGLAVLWGIISLLFLIFYTLGDPVEYLVEDQADADTKAAIRERYGLDQPLYVQYFKYLNQLSPLGVKAEPETGFGFKAPNLGRSYQSNQTVSAMIGSRIEGTLILALAAIMIAAILGIGLGVVASLNRDNWIDRSILSFSVLGISAPSFFIGVLVAWLFAVRLREFTGLNVSGHMFEENVFAPGRQMILKNLFLPALALGIRPLAVFIQLTRSSMLDVLQADYIRTARAKGLTPWRVRLQHALRNALNPVLTSATGWLASLLAGAFFIEYIFDWQGVGKLTIDALNTNDFPVILGSALFIGMVFVVVSILTDWLYRVLDPRVKL
jgi:ABC-type dipeptide/oligopeptide/nickel transport system permease component